MANILLSTAKLPALIEQLNHCNGEAEIARVQAFIQVRLDELARDEIGVAKEALCSVIQERKDVNKEASETATKTSAVIKWATVVIAISSIIQVVVAFINK